MRIAICEDDAADAKLIKGLMSEHSERYAGNEWEGIHFFSARALLESLDSGEKYECYLLDILMERQNGIELARELRRRGDRSPIFFLTSSSDYALPAFSVRAAGYLLKPVTKTCMFEALDILSEEAELRRKGTAQQFSFRIPGGVRTVLMSEIIYVEIMGHTPFFHLTGGVVRGSETRVSFSECVAPLIRSGGFLHPHRSFLVNAAHVVVLNTKSLNLDSGAVIPMARTRAAEVRSQYLDYAVAEAEHNV